MLARETQRVISKPRFPTHPERSVWVFGRGDSRIIVPVFIDDMVIACKSRKDVAKVKDDLRSLFKLRDLGPTSWLLGVEIKRDRSKRSISLSQRQYIIQILARFGFADCDSVSTPMDPGVKLSATMAPTASSEKEEMQNIPYINAVGALAYLAIATRPDIAFAISVLARFSQNPGMMHWKAVKHLFRYLQGTKDLCIVYAPDASTRASPLQLFATFSDADHGGNPDNGRSTSSYVVKIGTSAISWSSRLQSVTALSTTEAEYISAVSAGQEIIWLRNLFTELGYDLTSPSTLFIDNRSTVDVAKNPEHHGRVKHMDLRDYWLRDVVSRGEIQVQHIRTDDMPADIMTKALARQKVVTMQGLLGLRRVEFGGSVGS